MVSGILWGLGWHCQWIKGDCCTLIMWDTDHPYWCLILLKENARKKETYLFICILILMFVECFLYARHILSALNILLVAYLKYELYV
jgi:hypothetical protein